MKANELRIGNLVDLGNRIAKVIEINHLGCVVVDLEETQDTIEDYERTKPIPLTEEWLVKFGFVEIKRHTHDFEEVFYSKSIINGQPNHNETLVISLPLNHCEIGEYNIEESYLMNINIDYVHQLQNLYFALTGEELEFNL